MKKTVLKRGLNFCPNKDLDRFEIYKDLQLFVCKLILKKIYHKSTTTIDQTPQEIQALDQLISLLEEKDPADLIDWVELQGDLETVDKQSEPRKIGKFTLKKKSDLCPAPSTHPNAAAFLNLINREAQDC